MSSPTAICASRQVLRHGKLETQLLVQWDDCAPEEVTWEPLEAFRTTYPTFHLEDKVLFQGGKSYATPK